MSDELAIAAATIEITEKQRKHTVELIRRHGRDIGDIRALRQAGVQGQRGQLRRLLDADGDLRDEIAEARGRSPDRIEAALIERAIDGWLEPVFYKGGEVGYIRKFSDSLLAMAAKAHVPAYRDVTRHEHVGPDGGPLEVENPDVAAAIDRFTTTIGRLAERAAESRGAVRELDAGSTDEAARTAGS